MACSLRIVSLPLVLGLVACTGNPIEGQTGSLGEDASTTDGSTSLTGGPTSTATTATTMSSASMGSDSDDGSTGPTTSPTTTSPTTTADTSDSNTDPSTTASASDTDDDTSSTGDPTQGTESSSSDGGPEVCAEDEPPHNMPDDAFMLDGLDCDADPVIRNAIIDSAAAPDLWWFFGADPNGGCEPDEVRVEVTAGGPLPVCVTATMCDFECDTGELVNGLCCNADVVVIAVNCNMGDDDSSPIGIAIGEGDEVCQPYTFEYEF